MFNKFKIATVLVAGVLAMSACSTDSTPKVDTSIPLDVQIANADISTDPDSMSHEKWTKIAGELCVFEHHVEVATVNEAMLIGNLQEVWDYNERAVLADILFANVCPERLEV